MRVLQLIALIALAASVATESDARVLAADHKQTKRSLRQYDPEELGEVNSKNEERVSTGMIDDVVTKAGGLVDDVMGKVDDVAGKAGQAGKASSKLKELVTKNMGKLEDMAAHSSLVERLSGRYKYADKLSLSALKQLDEIEKVRLVDIEKGIKGTKTTANGMRRDITPFEGIKTAPKKYLESHILLISSSNPKKGDFLLPKGGWDKGENIKKAALREVIEEGGVGGQLANGLGKVKLQEGTDKYTYYAYLMKSSTVYDDWSESIRYRLWVSMDDAMEMLAGRPQMAEVVRRAKHVDDKIAAGTLPELNAGLAKVKLD
ncbi:hypothetical protein JG688_00017357 [Phytophthora aleatoria]|uniref:Nudix hydrolase domain-containing protein n=1 Tax=Phytophthora aleatoria TaxID=2496075 RepID=A0A8J5IX87_9STRA|nr:hypothetical protein JG688_00017357 [Phytophthora aleatoria]